MKQHIPRVEIVTPVPRQGMTENILTRLTIDGAEWAVVGYRVEGADVHGVQHLTLTFLADVTVTHTPGDKG